MSDSLPEENQYQRVLKSAPPKQASTTEENRAERRESIKELYSYALARLNAERERFQRADEKANKLAAMFIFIMGGVLFFEKLIEKQFPPKSLLDWLLAIVSVLALFTSFYGWFLCVRAVKLRAVAELPLDMNTIRFFEENGASNVRYAWAKQMAAAYQKNVKITDDKQSGIHAATDAMTLVVCAIVLLSLLFLLRLST